MCGWVEHIEMPNTQREVFVFKRTIGPGLSFCCRFDLACCDAWYPRRTWLLLVVLCKRLNLAWCLLIKQLGNTGLKTDAKKESSPQESVCRELCEEAITAESTTFGTTERKWEMEFVSVCMCLYYTLGDMVPMCASSLKSKPFKRCSIPQQHSSTCSIKTWFIWDNHTRC